MTYRATYSKSFGNDKMLEVWCETPSLESAEGATGYRIVWPADDGFKNALSLGGHEILELAEAIAELQGSAEEIQHILGWPSDDAAPDEAEGELGVTAMSILQALVDGQRLCFDKITAVWGLEGGGDVNLYWVSVLKNRGLIKPTSQTTDYPPSRTFYGISDAGCVALARQEEQPA